MYIYGVVACHLFEHYSLSAEHGGSHTRLTTQPTHPFDCFIGGGVDSFIGDVVVLRRRRDVSGEVFVA